VPQQAWSDKRERQYEHVKQSAEDRGESEDRAEEIAARTVNKNRARSGEADQAGRTSLDDVSPQHRGGSAPTPVRRVAPRPSCTRMRSAGTSRAGPA
jgi:hypothetical protein